MEAKTEVKTKFKQYVFSFQEGDGHNKNLLGGKGANLCEMTQIGLNVPPGFVITTEACLEYLDPRTRPPDGLANRCSSHIGVLEQKTGKGFGGPRTRCWFRCARVRRCPCPA